MSWKVGISFWNLEKFRCAASSINKALRTMEFETLFPLLWIVAIAGTHISYGVMSIIFDFFSKAVYSFYHFVHCHVHTLLKLISQLHWKRNSPIILNILIFQKKFYVHIVVQYNPILYNKMYLLPIFKNKKVFRYISINRTRSKTIQVVN